MKPAKWTIYRVRAFEPSGELAYEADYGSEKSATFAARQIARHGSAAVFEVKGYPEFHAWSPGQLLSCHGEAPEAVTRA